MQNNEPPSTKPKGFFDRLAAAFHDDAPADREAVRETLREALERGLIDTDTCSMMEGALTVSELRAHELMVPRSQIYAIDLSEPQETWLSIVNESGHSRFPAVDGDLDNVLGLIHAKDLLKLITKPDLDVKTLLRPARFIPESQPAGHRRCPACPAADSGWCGSPARRPRSPAATARWHWPRRTASGR